MMLSLTPAQRSQLRAKAHKLDPVVIIGQAGLSDAVIKEIKTHLTAHELIKVRIMRDDRVERQQMLQDICEKCAAAPVQHIGKLLVIYRDKNSDVK